MGGKLNDKKNKMSSMKKVLVKKWKRSMNNIGSTRSSPAKYYSSSEELDPHGSYALLISNNPPPPPPVGYLGVYVDGERFLIPTRFLNLPIFASLLHQAEQEYGSSPDSGAIAFPCDLHLFHQLLRLLQLDEHKYGNLNLTHLHHLLSINNLH